METYVCIECGKETELDLVTSRRIQCPYCGYRILRKTRGQTPRVVKAV